MKLWRAVRGPFWYVVNILAACWRFNLQEIIDRPGQTPAKRFIFRCVISIETVLEGVFLIVMIGVLGSFSMVYFPMRWVWGELQETWT